MSPVVVMFVVFAICLLIGVPIAWSIGIPVAIYLGMTGMFSPTYIASTMYTACDTFPLMAIPLFVLAGTLMEGGGLSKRLIDFADSLCGHITGGLAVITVITCMFFGALSGSSAATVVAIGTIMVPYMRQMGYSKGFSYALITAAGCLGVLIPPSIPLVLYGIATNASIGNLFLGGFGSGFAVGGALIIVSLVICFARGYRGNGRKFSIKRVFTTFVDAIGALMVPIIILGGIYGGFFTPTEAAAVASVYGIIVGFLIYRELNFRKFYDCLKSSVVSASMIMLIVAAAAAYSYVMTRQQVPVHVTELITGMTDSYVVFMLLVIVLLLVMGCFMETCASILVVTPMLLPICQTLNVDLVSFGVIMVVTLAIGFVTPPMGLNLFVAARLTNTSVDTVINKHLFILIGIAIVITLLITFVPGIITWLPNLMAS